MLGPEDWFVTGQRLEEGTGVAADTRGAERYYKLAAKLGSAPAKLHLAHLRYAKQPYFGHEEGHPRQWKGPTQKRPTNMSPASDMPKKAL